MRGEMQYTLEANTLLSAKAGTQVIVPYRNEDEKRHLKVMGDLGQIVPMVGNRRRAFVLC